MADSLQRTPGPQVVASICHAAAVPVEKVAVAVRDMESDLQCPIWDCINKATKRGKIKCPVCKAPANKRDLARSELLQNVVGKYMKLLAAVQHQQHRMSAQQEQQSNLEEFDTALIEQENEAGAAHTDETEKATDNQERQAGISKPHAVENLDSHVLQEATNQQGSHRHSCLDSVGKPDRSTRFDSTTLLENHGGQRGTVQVTREQCDNAVISPTPKHQLLAAADTCIHTGNVASLKTGKTIAYIDQSRAASDVLAGQHKQKVSLLSLLDSQINKTNQDTDPIITQSPSVSCKTQPRITTTAAAAGAVEPSVPAFGMTTVEESGNNMPDAAAVLPQASSRQAGRVASGKPRIKSLFASNTNSVSRLEPLTVGNVSVGVPRTLRRGRAAAGLQKTVSSTAKQPQAAHHIVPNTEACKDPTAPASTDLHTNVIKAPEDVSVHDTDQRSVLNTDRLQSQQPVLSPVVPAQQDAGLETAATTDNRHDAGVSLAQANDQQQPDEQQQQQQEQQDEQLQQQQQQPDEQQQQQPVAFTACLNSSNPEIATVVQNLMGQSEFVGNHSQGNTHADKQALQDVDEKHKDQVPQDAAAGMPAGQLDRPDCGTEGLLSPGYLGLVTVHTTPGNLKGNATVQRRVPLRLMPWGCPRCTLHNPATARKCNACKTPRPANAPLVTPSSDTVSKSSGTGGSGKRKAGDTNLPTPKRIMGASNGSKSACKNIAQMPDLIDKKSGTAAVGTTKRTTNQAQQRVEGKKRMRKDAASDISEQAAVIVTENDAGIDGAVADDAKGAGTVDNNKAKPKKRSKTVAVPTPQTTPAATPLPHTTKRRTVTRGKSAAPETPSTVAADKDKTTDNHGITATEGVQSARGRVGRAKTPAVITTPAPGTVSKKAQHVTAETASAWGDASTWVLLGSGLTEGERGLLKRLASLSGCTAEDVWRPGVTHVICGTDSQKRARRTVKYLLGVAHGCWVVDLAWVKECVNKGGHISPDKYEITQDLAGGLNGPAVGRARKAQQTSTPLLHGYSLYFAGSYQMFKEDLMAVAKAVGATVLKRPPPPASQPIIEVIKQQQNAETKANTKRGTKADTKAKRSEDDDKAEADSDKKDDMVLILVDVECCESKSLKPKDAVGSAAASGLPIVSHKWLLDCVGTQSVADIQAHAVK